MNKTFAQQLSPSQPPAEKRDKLCRVCFRNAAVYFIELDSPLGIYRQNIRRLMRKLDSIKLKSIDIPKLVALRFFEEK